jgi:hypothetical protein
MFPVPSTSWRIFRNWIWDVSAAWEIPEAARSLFTQPVWTNVSLLRCPCSLCAYQNSIGDKDHCPDNYIPGVLRYFELGDLAGAIAPRPMVVVAGRQDLIFPIEGVRAAHAIVERIYEAVGAAGQCRLVVGEGGHRFYAAPSWPVFRELARW